jgi:hypothetical protein
MVALFPATKLRHRTMRMERRRLQTNVAASAKIAEASAIG